MTTVLHKGVNDFPSLGKEDMIMELLKPRLWKDNTRDLTIGDPSSGECG